MTGRRRTEIDGLRGIAALLLLTFHTVGSTQLPLVGELARTTWVGVNLFFVLSGFLITGILVDARTDPHYFRNFYARRILRIWPVYYLLILFAFTVAPKIPRLSFDTHAEHAIFYAFFVQNIAIPDRFGAWPLAVTWSLAVEEQFYFVWPLLVRFLSNRQVVRFSIAVLLLSPIARLFALYRHASLLHVYIGTIYRADSLAIGSLLAVMMREHSAALSLAWKTFRGIALTALGGSLIIMVLSRQGSMPADTVSSGTAIGYSLLQSALAIGFGALLLWALAPGATRFRAFLSSRYLVFLGTVSYGLYLIHGSVVAISFALVRRHLQSLPPSLIAVLLVLGQWIVSIALAAASWSLIERPILDLRRYFEPKTLPPAAEPVSDVLR